MGRSSLVVKFIALGGILAAMSAILKYFSIESTVIRVTFYDIPVMFSGIVMGPLFGGMVGFAADVSKFSQYGFNLMTLSSILWGVIPGFIFLIHYLIIRDFKLNKLLLIITIVFTSVICFSINTYQLYLWRGWGSIVAELPSRLVIMIFKFPIQYFIITLVFERTKHMIPTFRRRKVINKIIID